MRLRCGFIARTQDRIDERLNDILIVRQLFWNGLFHAFFVYPVQAN